MGNSSPLDHETRRRHFDMPTSDEEIQAARRMLQDLQYHTEIWRTPVSRWGPVRTFTNEWRSIAQAATGNPDDVRQLQNWFQRIKEIINYRLNVAVMKGFINREMLMAEGNDGLLRLYRNSPFPFWREAEYLTKLLIFRNQSLGVDIDGIHASSDDLADDPPKTPQNKGCAEGYCVCIGGVFQGKVYSGEPSFFTASVKQEPAY